MKASGICFDGNGIMYIADENNNRVRKVYDPEGVAALLPFPKDLSVWPNPAQNELLVSSSAKISSLVICNLLGQIMCSHEYDSKQVNVNVADLAAGIYILKINGSEVRKFVKE